MQIQVNTDRVRLMDHAGPGLLVRNGGSSGIRFTIYEDGGGPRCDSAERSSASALAGSH